MCCQVHIFSRHIVSAKSLLSLCIPVFWVLWLLDFKVKYRLPVVGMVLYNNTTAITL